MRQEAVSSHNAAAMVRAALAESAKALDDEHRFELVEQLAQGARYNAQWLIAKNAYRSPDDARSAWDQVLFRQAA